MVQNFDISPVLTIFNETRQYAILRWTLTRVDDSFKISSEQLIATKLTAGHISSISPEIGTIRVFVGHFEEHSVNQDGPCHHNILLISS